MSAGSALVDSGFAMFSLAHGLAVAGVVVGIAAFVVAGLWLRRGSAREAGFGRAAGWLIVGWQLAAQVFWLTDKWDAANSLPLHLCDVTNWLAGVSLIGGWRWVRSLVFYWGLLLSWVAFVVPSLESGPGTMHFWLYWVGHAQIYGVGVYEVAVRGYRPRWGDLWVAQGAMGVMFVLAVPANEWLNASYWYIGRDSSPYAVEQAGWFGPWPWRIGVMWAGVLVVQLVATWVCGGKGGGGALAGRR